MLFPRSTLIALPVTICTLEEMLKSSARGKKNNFLNNTVLLKKTCLASHHRCLMHTEDFLFPGGGGHSPRLGEGQLWVRRERMTSAGFRNRSPRASWVHSWDQQGQLHLTGKLLPFPSAQWSENFTWWEALLATRKLWNIFESFQFQVAFLEQPAAGNIYFARGKQLHLRHRYSQSPMQLQGTLKSKQAFCHPVFTVKTPQKKKS